MAGGKKHARPTGGAGAPVAVAPPASDEKPIKKSKPMDLEALKDKDPEFYKYLQKHDANLLNFSESEMSEDDSDVDLPDAGDEDADGDDDGAEGDESAAVSMSQSGIPLTLPLLSSLTDAAFVKRSQNGMSSLLTAFRSACHAHEAPEEEAKAARHSVPSRKYVIHSSSVFTRLMTECLDGFHSLFWEFLGSGGKGSAPKQSVEAKIRALVCAHACSSSLTHLKQYRGCAVVDEGPVQAVTSPHRLPNEPHLYVSPSVVVPCSSPQ